jgi:RNA recognition motif-containing protein
MNLYIGNLNYTVKEQELQELFSQIGEVSSAKIITDKFTGRSRGFGFVEMPNDAEATKAIEQLNGHSLKERELSVTQAQPRTEGGGGGGNRGGGFNRDRGGRGGNEGYNNNRY